MNETKCHLILLVFICALANAHYLKHSSFPFYNGRMVKLAPKEAIWRQMHSSKLGENSHSAEETDQLPAASDHESDYHRGRVQIKVYRGPDDDHHDFAPYGFWIKQPADHGY